VLPDPELLDLAVHRQPLVPVAQRTSTVEQALHLRVDEGVVLQERGDHSRGVGKIRAPGPDEGVGVALDQLPVRKKRRLDDARPDADLGELLGEILRGEPLELAER